MPTSRLELWIAVTGISGPRQLRSWEDFPKAVPPDASYVHPHRPFFMIFFLFK